jgi:hypothetical protein
MDPERRALPAVSDVAAALVELVRTHQPVHADELDRKLRDHFGRDEDDAAFADLADDRFEELTDESGPLALLAGDRIVEVASLSAGVVLTHRLNDAERELGVITVACDLALFERFDTLELAAGGTVEAFSVEAHHLAWHLPEGLLAAHDPGTLLAARVDADGRLHLDTVADEPALDPDFVASVRAAYDAEHEVAGLPVWSRDLMLTMLAHDRNAFARVRPPLAELAAAAGLQHVQDEFAHAPEVWRHARMLRRASRLHARLDFEDARGAASLIASWDGGSTDPADLQAWLAALHDPFLLDALAEAIFVDGDDAALDDTDELTAGLETVARRPAEHAVVYLLRALVDERRHRVVDAEAHLRDATHADPEWAPALDRLAWYASDRGDARLAAQLWSRAGRRGAQDLATGAAFARGSGSTVGRNSPCWCGSGRKFKQCHLGVTEAAPLPDRVGWMCRKAAGFLERRGGDATDDVFAFAGERAADAEDPASLADALDDPIVLDVVLHEGGWFERFLDERGPLLPDDELLLMRAWTLVDRTVYEVVATDPGEGMVVRDLRSGDRIDVRERMFSRDARPGALVCGRAVPDGDRHQFVGGLFHVRPGTETHVLALVEQDDPVALLHYVRDKERPPEVRNREGEALIDGRAVVRITNAAAARRVLDRRYDRDDESDTWRELHALNADEDILRAELALVGGEVHVSANSAERLDRVLDVLIREVPGAVVTDETRAPLVLPASDAGGLGFEAPTDPAVLDAIEEYRARMEERWCDEEVPALGGRTPRAAVGDPTRRDEVRRLIASFPEPPPGSFGMRPGRLLELLDLDAS